MNFPALVADIRSLASSAQGTVARVTDRVLTLRSWLVGAWIVEYEQHGEDRAAYGEGLIERLADELERGGTPGMSPSNLKNFRQLVLSWPDLDPGRTLIAVLGPIRQTLTGESDPDRQTASGVSALMLRASAGFPSLAARAAVLHRLPWQDQAWTERLFASVTFSHLLELSRIDQPLARAFYELELLKEGWAVRELKRQINSMLFERVGLSRDRDAFRSGGPRPLSGGPAGGDVRHHPPRPRRTRIPRLARAARVQRGRVGVRAAGPPPGFPPRAGARILFR